MKLIGDESDKELVLDDKHYFIDGTAVEVDGVQTVLPMSYADIGGWTWDWDGGPFIPSCGRVWFEPPSGRAVVPVDVTLTSPWTHEGAPEIHYTLDGSIPSAESQLYTGPIHLTAATVIRAIATTPRIQWPARLWDGPICNASYTSATWVEAPTGGVGPTSQPISISSWLILSKYIGFPRQEWMLTSPQSYYKPPPVHLNPGPVVTPDTSAEVYFSGTTYFNYYPDPNYITHYTLDGSEPTLASPIMDGPILISNNTIVKVIQEARIDTANPDPDNGDGTGEVGDPTTIEYTESPTFSVTSMTWVGNDFTLTIAASIPLDYPGVYEITAIAFARQYQTSWGWDCSFDMPGWCTHDSFNISRRVWGQPQFGLSGAGTIRPTTLLVDGFAAVETAYYVPAPSEVVAYYIARLAPGDHVLELKGTDTVHSSSGGDTFPYRALMIMPPVGENWTFPQLRLDHYPP